MLEDGKVVTSPGGREVGRAKSLHVFAFTGANECVLVESEGVFEIAEWEEAARVAEMACRGVSEGAEEQGVGLAGWLRRVIEEDIKDATRWKGNL